MRKTLPYVVKRHGWRHYLHFSSRRLVAASQEHKKYDKN